MMNNQASIEYLAEYGIFERSNMIRRASEIMSRIADSSTMILPKNAMLHIVDNISHSQASTDAFDINAYPFLKTKNSIKYLHSFTDFEVLDRDLLRKFANRIYRPKLAETLRRFGLAHRKNLIPLPKLDQVVDNKNTVLVENYNPLYRLIATGNRPIGQYHRYKAIMTTVLENTVKYDRTNFIVVSVPDNFTYVRQNLMSIIMAGEVSQQKLISTSHFYFFILDLVALLINNQSTISTFRALNTPDINALNIMFVNGNQCIAFNLGKLVSLARTKAYIFGLIDNISRISGTDVIPQTTDEEDETPVLVEDDNNQLPETQEADIVVQRKLKTSPVIAGIKRNLKDGKVITRVITPEAPVIADDEDFIEDEDIIDESENEAPIPALTSAEPSPRQLSRLEALKERHRSIKVSTSSGMMTIGEILDEPVPLPIQNDDIPLADTEGIEPSMLQSATQSFSSQYQEKLLRKDILASLVTFSDNGLFVIGYSEVNEYTSFSRVKHAKVSFQDAKGKKHTVHFKIPMPDEEGYYLVNGVNLSMSKQLVNVPICKISPTRVSLISNYNKTLVDKVSSVRYSLPDFIAKNAKELGIATVPKANTYIGIDVPFDYKQIGGRYLKLTNDQYTFHFEYATRNKQLGAPETLPEFENQFGVLVGRAIRDKNVLIFMGKDNMCTVADIAAHNLIEMKIPITSLLGKFDVPMEWCDLKILDKNLPVVFILGYRYGITKILTNLKIKHRFVLRQEHKPTDLKPTELIIEFLDGWLVFDRYPLEHSYILAGLRAFVTLKRYAFSDLDGDDGYYQLLSDRGMSTNYLKGINAYFNFFIDPITKEVLHEMGEPTNTRDLLIRAVDMLINTTDKEPSAISNFRVRSAEMIPGIIYNEISRQYANYVNSNFKDVSFSINTEAIFQRIIQDQTMTLRESINPIHAIKEDTKVTYTGFGGRSAEAFVARDRKYPKDAIGILSETTTDSGSVGMVSSFSGNPRIKNLRGMFEENIQDVNMTNTLSDVALLMPGATNDDQHVRQLSV